MRHLKLTKNSLTSTRDSGSSKVISRFTIRVVALVGMTLGVSLGVMMTTPTQAHAAASAFNFSNSDRSTFQHNFPRFRAAVQSCMESTSVDAYGLASNIRNTNRRNYRDEGSNFLVKLAQGKGKNLTTSDLFVLGCLQYGFQVIPMERLWVAIMERSTTQGLLAKLSNETSKDRVATISKMPIYESVVLALQELTPWSKVHYWNVGSDATKAGNASTNQDIYESCAGDFSDPIKCPPEFQDQLREADAYSSDVKPTSAEAKPPSETPAVPKAKSDVISRYPFLFHPDSASHGYHKAHLNAVLSDQKYGRISVELANIDWGFGALTDDPKDPGKMVRAYPKSLVRKGALAIITTHGNGFWLISGGKYAKIESDRYHFWDYRPGEAEQRQARFSPEERKAFFRSPPFEVSHKSLREEPFSRGGFPLSTSGLRLMLEDPPQGTTYGPAVVSQSRTGRGAGKSTQDQRSFWSNFGTNK